MSHFYDHVTSESETISEILSQQIPLSDMTDDDRRRHRAATTCVNCNGPFTHHNYKVRHHCHVTGQYLFPTCNNCNLQLKPPKCKDNKYFLPIIFHNLTNYDAHYVIKYFERRHTQKIAEGQKVTYDDIKIIPLNGEQFLQFQIGNLKFLNSFQFLSSSFENIVSLLFKDGKHNFHTTKYLGDHDLGFAKGIYPYSYMTDRSKFDETRLPSIENFFNSINNEPLSDEDYRCAQQIWKFFDIKTLQQYHNHYLMSDVLLLADVFEHFPRDVLQKHGLDCLHYPTLLSLAWSMALKHAGAELDLIIHPQMYLMIENSIHGGSRPSPTDSLKANNPLLPDFYPSKPTTFITYLDANNLYGSAQSEPLPVGNFKFLNTDEITTFDLMSVPEDAPTGYIIDCDLDYPSHLHDAHSDYLLAPEHLVVSPEMLSPFARNLSGKGWRPAQKLIRNLYSKIHYVTHYRNLQFYLKHGLVLTKIHRVLSFTQRPWHKPWIQLCTSQRQNARSEFEAQLANSRQIRHTVKLWNRFAIAKYSTDSRSTETIKSGQQTVVSRSENNQLSWSVQPARKSC